MIRVNSITIEEFRGIRHLKLDFHGNNFAICGPNGTGKSGVVDALEFALTGNVSRLSGEGRGDISLKEHGPHVDIRGDPDKACVTVDVTIPSLNKTAIIVRRVKTPAHAEVTPNEPAVLEVLGKVAEHPEFVLSRRELIRYVLATPGKRAEEVQALLHLDQVEQVRTSLQKIANSCQRQLASLATAATHARDNLLRVIGISKLSTEGFLGEANKQRALLGLVPLTGLTDTTSLKDGMATPAPAQPQRIPKKQAIADIRAARDIVEEITAESTAKLAAKVAADLTTLSCDPALAKSVQRESFYATGMDLIEDEACPFCDTSWNMAELKQHVKTKIDHLKDMSSRHKKAQKEIAPLITVVRKTQATVNNLVGYAALASPPLASDSAHSYCDECETAIKKLTVLLPLAEAVDVLNNLATVPPAVLDAIGDIEEMVLSLPDPTQDDAAREWLTVAQERFEVFRKAERAHDSAEAQYQTAREVADIYAKTSDMVLTDIYRAVEENFASLYGFINREDENTFKAQLIPSMGKLGFDVDFYGRGFFPPGAYHSEGHQDAMGLCLYFALMRYIEGASFTFAVLDDVLMSVDVGHRREACALLKSEFSNTQFIMTTHDPIWVRHMKTEGLIHGRSAVQFRSWDVDHGPAQWDDRDVWAEIGDNLEQNDVRAAAALLRNYLEFASAELCHRLRAPVEFRGDARYQLGELLPAAIGRLRKIYSRAKDAASSWNQRDIVDVLAKRASTFSEKAQASNAEQWQVNVAIHYNSWENLSKEDFEPVVIAFRDLFAEFICLDCNEYLRVSPDRATPESLRCECGITIFNLCKKKA